MCDSSHMLLLLKLQRDSNDVNYDAFHIPHCSLREVRYLVCVHWLLCSSNQYNPCLSVSLFNLHRRGRGPSMLWMLKNVSTQNEVRLPHFFFAPWTSYLMRDVRSVFKKNLPVTSLSMSVFVQIETPPSDPKTLKMKW